MTKSKLTMVSIWARGQRFTAFVNLPTDSDGKVRVSWSAVESITGKLPTGTVIGIGV